MDPEMINSLSNQILIALKAMEKTKNLEEKLKYSEMVKNLCDSLGVFLNLAGRFNDDFDPDEYDEFEDENDSDDDDNSIPFRS